MERAKKQTLEQVVNGFKLEEDVKRLLLEVAREKGATSEDMEQVIRMMSTEILPDNSFHPNPLVDQAISSASERAIEVYGTLQLRILEETFKPEAE
jgi:hypothetical protein